MLARGIEFRSRQQAYDGCAEQPHTQCRCDDGRAKSGRHPVDISAAFRMSERVDGPGHQGTAGRNDHHVGNPQNLLADVQIRKIFLGRKGAHQKLIRELIKRTDCSIRHKVTGGGNPFICMAIERKRVSPEYENERKEIRYHQEDCGNARVDQHVAFRLDEDKKGCERHKAYRQCSPEKDIQSVGDIKKPVDIQKRKQRHDKIDPEDQARCAFHNQCNNNGMKHRPRDCHNNLQRNQAGKLTIAVFDAMKQAERVLPGAVTRQPKNEHACDPRRYDRGVHCLTIRVGAQDAKYIRHRDERADQGRHVGEYRVTHSTKHLPHAQAQLRSRLTVHVQPHRDVAACLEGHAQSL